MSWVEVGKVAVMAVGDIFRLIVNQTIFGQNALNVFWYRNSVPGGNGGVAQDLLDIFNSALWPLIQDFQSIEVDTIDLEALNFNSLTDFGSLTVGTAGVRAGEALPGFVTWAFALRRSSTLIRNGRKSFAGVAEDDQANGLPTAGALALLELAEDPLSATLIADDDSEWMPVIVRKPTVPLPTIPFFVTMLRADFVRISTQNSRKA